MDEILSLSAFHESLTGFLMTLTLCSLRTFVAFIVIPATSQGSLQGISRQGITLLFGIFVAFGQPIQAQAIPALMLFMIVAKEAVLGLVLGFAAATVFWVAESVGVFIDDLAGFNNVQVSNPMRNDTSTPVSTLLSQLSITAFWALGGMMFLLGAIYQSFQWWPILQFDPVPRQIFESFALNQADTLMQMTAKIAMPMLLILLLVDFAFGFLSKGADQLDTFSLSMPVKGVLTLLLVAVFTWIFVEQIKGEIALENIGAQFHAVRKQGGLQKTRNGQAKGPGFSGYQDDRR